LRRATSIGTKYFLENSNIQLQHNLQKSNLFINPIVIGNPFTLQNGYDETCDALYYGAVMEDRCNCFYVYSNNEAGVWHSKSMSKLVESGIDRESLVTVANMGNVRNRDDVMQQLENAKKLTDQEFIDIAMLNVRHLLTHTLTHTLTHLLTCLLTYPTIYLHIYILMYYFFTYPLHHLCVYFAVIYLSSKYIRSHQRGKKVLLEISTVWSSYWKSCAVRMIFIRMDFQ
jgi:hypothetical protein